MPQKSCQYLHLILFFSPSQRAHGWPTNEVSFEDIFISYFSCSVSMISSLLWLFLVLGPCSVHELWERKSGFDCELLQGYMFTRFRWHGRTELNRKDFKWFNTPASLALFFFLAANMVRIDHGLKKRSMGFLTKRHHYRALIFPLAWIAAPRHQLDILYFHPS